MRDVCQRNVCGPAARRGAYGRNNYDSDVDDICLQQDYDVGDICQDCYAVDRPGSAEMALS
jgi:hypothetical protein